MVITMNIATMLLAGLIIGAPTIDNPIDHPPPCDYKIIGDRNISGSYIDNVESALDRQLRNSTRHAGTFRLVSNGPNAEFELFLSEEAGERRLEINGIIHIVDTPQTAILAAWPELSSHCAVKVAPVWADFNRERREDAQDCPEGPTEQPEGPMGEELDRVMTDNDKRARSLAITALALGSVGLATSFGLSAASYQLLENYGDPESGDYQREPIRKSSESLATASATTGLVLLSTSMIVGAFALSYLNQNYSSRKNLRSAKIRHPSIGIDPINQSLAVGFHF